MDTTNEADRAAGLLARDKRERHDVAVVIDRQTGIKALKRVIDANNANTSNLELKLGVLRRVVRRSGISLSEREQWALAEYESIEERPKAGAAAMPTTQVWYKRWWARLWRLRRQAFKRKTQALPQVVPGTMRPGVYDIGDIPRVALLRHYDGWWGVLELETFWPVQGPLVWMPVYVHASGYGSSAERAIAEAAMLVRGTAQDRSRYQVGPGAQGEIKPVDPSAAQE